MVVTPYSRQCFIWAAATVIFGWFWSDLCKKCLPYILPRRRKKIGFQILFQPLNCGGFYCHFSRIGIFFSKIDDFRALLRAFSNSGKLAGIQLWSNEAATDKKTIRNYYSKIEGQPLPIYKQRFAKKSWSKTTHPDDQDKGPMIDTKIIYTCNLPIKILLEYVR